MIQQSTDTGWRSTLQELYGRLLDILHGLSKTKHQEYQTGDADTALTERLQNYINLRPPQKDANLDVIIHANKVSMATRIQAPAATDRTVKVSNSFSQALNERHGTDLLNNSAGHKLVQSALDHLHTSVRYAKAGDAEAAHVHADIMNSALREAANYASETEYRELVHILDNAINRLS